MFTLEAVQRSIKVEEISKSTDASVSCSSNGKYSGITTLILFQIRASMAFQKSGSIGPQGAPNTRNITVLSILQYHSVKMGVSVVADVQWFQMTGEHHAKCVKQSQGNRNYSYH